MFLFILGPKSEYHTHRFMHGRVFSDYYFELHPVFKAEKTWSLNNEIIAIMKIPRKYIN